MEGKSSFIQHVGSYTLKPLRPLGAQFPGRYVVSSSTYLINNSI